ncbi:hypothetical protein BDC45DRAFT_524410 [Circinella umbellata]|nr:hypothetical protein BDC45DRAFT_524410 [Circinella umbellata]
MATSTQSPLAQHWGYYLNGVEQAFNWPKTFILFYSSSTVQKSLFKSLFLNGVVFFGGLLILETFYNGPEHRLLGCSYAVKNKIIVAKYKKKKWNFFIAINGCGGES